MKLQTYITLELLKNDEFRASLHRAVSGRYCDNIEEGAARFARALCRETGDDPDSQVTPCK